MKVLGRILLFGRCTSETRQMTGFGQALATGLNKKVARFSGFKSNVKVSELYMFFQCKFPVHQHPKYLKFCLYLTRIFCSNPKRETSAITALVLPLRTNSLKTSHLTNLDWPAERHHIAQQTFSATRSSWCDAVLLL